MHYSCSLFRSGLAGRPAVPSAVAGVCRGRGQSPPVRPVAVLRLPVQLRERADRLRQHRLAVAGPRPARPARQPHPRRLRRRVPLRRRDAAATGRRCRHRRRRPQRLPGSADRLHWLL